MKLTMKLCVLLFGMLILVNVAYAESPREQLQQMVEQLQKFPRDNALREKIITLAQRIKPAPNVPDEVERRMARGTAAFKGAKSIADYRDAAKEFEQATLAAPWLGDAYLNLGVAQDKAENYEAALRSLKLALLASPSDKEIKALIYEVEYRSERASSPEAQAAKRKQQQEDERRATEEMIRGLEGAIFINAKNSESVMLFLRIREGKVEDVTRKLQSNLCPCDGGDAMCNLPVGAEVMCIPRASFVGKTAEIKTAGGFVFRYEISNDWREIRRLCGGRDDCGRYIRSQ